MVLVTRAHLKNPREAIARPVSALAALPILEVRPVRQRIGALPSPTLTTFSPHAGF